MKVLVGKVFGIGNAVLAVPMIRAIRNSCALSQLDVLVGTGPDDAGAYEVMSYLLSSGVIDSLYRDRVPYDGMYDVAVMAIPFDGRWRNGEDFHAHIVLDGRTRPDPRTVGLSSWKKHEVLYMMENLIDMGLDEPEGDGQFLDSSFGPHPSDGRYVYLGMGYKKDPAGQWKVKHWGNESYAELAILLLNENVFIRTSGDAADMQMTMGPVWNMTGRDQHFKISPSRSLRDAFKEVAGAVMYVGNDTGMMHVAASQHIPTIGLFFMENSIVKNHPWGVPMLSFDGSRRFISPAEVFQRVMENIDAVH